MTKRQKKKLLPIIIAATVLVTGSLLPSLGLPGIPDWDTIFTETGLRGGETDDLPLQAHFIDIGQGDCTLIQSGGVNVLIDGAKPGNDKVINAYLKNHNVKQLDYLIATHPDSDHIGSLPEVIKAYPPKNVILPRLSEKNTPSTKNYTSLLSAIKASGAKAIAAELGKSYTIGEAKMEILAPFTQYDDTNNMSVVARVTLGNIAYLFTGDAETKSERDMLVSGRTLRADVLKAGHHGSKTGSGKAFLAAVNPKAVVISCGQDNSYGHPHMETLKKLTAIGAQVYRTDQLGTIIIATDGKELVTKWTKS
ncbi:MAG: MBL fold metallo-hydrolase [Oscillospiraceae bacterium]|jgi:competence protein ComEC|nr:MBL fold metallo-hydrolase [Oscillospiraceae bacterium]